MNEAKVEEMETRLLNSIHDYIGVRKIYEDQLRISHVCKERIVELEAKVQALENEVTSLREHLTQAEQIVAIEQREEHEGQQQPARDIVKAPIQIEDLEEE